MEGNLKQNAFLARRQLKKDPVPKTPDKTLYSAIVTGVLIAVIPAALTYCVAFIDGIRKDELAFTNSQIEKLYGPLFALTQANDAAWREFVAHDWRARGNPAFFNDSNPPTPAQVDVWRLWMTKVFQPLNIQMEQLIIANSQFIEGNYMSDSFENFIAHTEGYKAIMSTWSDKDKLDKESYVSAKRNTVIGLNFRLD
jgi:hypothetical protein